ncbi:MAG: PRC-barrel domain-containing protein [Rhodospirillales bacterium]
MLLALDDVRGYAIQTRDGRKGKAGDVFFDDHQWTVRYLVVDTGWLFGRKVLVAPAAVEAVDPAKEEIAVALTTQQIEDGPGVGADMPVSRQQEISLADYYGWPHYWDMYAPGMAGVPVVPPLPPGGGAAGERSPATDRSLENADPHLRSAREVEGYAIAATDGEIGSVSDFLFDDDGWSVRYLVVDTGTWLTGRKVLLAPSWATGIDWGERVVRVDTTREAVEKSPPFSGTGSIARDYERDLHDYYGRVPYWP